MMISNNCIEKVTVSFNRSIRILKAFCIGPLTNPDKNDFFNYDLNNIFASNNAVIEEDKNIVMRSGEQQKVFYIDKTDELNVGFDFSDFKLEDNQRIFVFANILSTCKKKAVIRFGKFNCRIKVWLNSVLIFNGYPDIFETDFVLSTLDEGNNIIIAECISTNTNKEQNLIFSMFISELGNESTHIENKFMKDFFKQSGDTKIQIINENCCIYKDIYKMLLIPKDFINIDLSKSLKISICNSKDEELECLNSNFYQRVLIDTSKYKINWNKSFALHLNIVYKDLKCEDRIQKHMIVHDYFLENIDGFLDYYEDYLVKFPFNQKTKIFYTGLLNDLKMSETELKSSIINNNPDNQQIAINKMMFYSKKIKNIITSENLPKTIAEHFNQRGTGIDVYYKSKLDESIEKYIICTPKSYSIEKTYPIIVYLVPYIVSTGEIFSSQLPDELSEDAFFALISTRNVTLGNYMGESSILESIQEIRKTYNIDDNRIYLIGFSNGAYACWSLIQAFPDIFTAAAPISGGVYEKNLENIRNVPFFAVFGEKDLPVFRQFYNITYKWIMEHKDIVSSKVILFKEFDHLALLPAVWYSKLLIEWLLKQRKQLFSTKSYYRTERMCHNGNEWIQILDVETGSKFCEFKLEVKNNSNILIFLENVKEFILMLPDYISKNDLKILINGDKILIPKAHRNNLSFSKNNSRYILTDNIQKQSYSSWGMGVLDIYMKSLKICITSSFSSSNEEAIIKQIANNFSEPKSQGYDPDIHVKYPIIKDNISKDILENSNIILIGCKNNNELLNELKKEFKIQINQDGFCYNGFNHIGEYSIIFIQPNPMYPKNKILVIYSNSLELLKKNTLLRKVIIPSYVNGFHPYLNCELIVFYGKSLYVANMIGDELYKP